MKYRFFKKPKKRYITLESIKNKEVIDNKEGENIEKEIKNISPAKKNKRSKNKEDMNDFERIVAAEATIEAMQPEVKVVKKDKGLIERTESSKIILTEDNRQLLKD